MSNKDEVKAEKRFKVNALGVVESVEVAPPLREADQQNSNPTGKKSSWYNTGNKASGIGGNIVEEEPTQGTKRPTGSKKSSKTKRKQSGNNLKGNTKSTNGDNTKEQNKEYSLPLVILAVIAFITLFDFGGSDANVSNVIPEPDEVVVSTANENVFSLFFGLIKNVLSFFWSIISFILDLLFSILGLK